MLSLSLIDFACFNLRVQKIAAYNTPMGSCGILSLPGSISPLLILFLFVNQNGGRFYK